MALEKTSAEAERGAEAHDLRRLVGHSRLLERVMDAPAGGEEGGDGDGS